jgi:hypothetical protein
MNNNAIINNQIWEAFEEEREKVLLELIKRNLETSLTAIKNNFNFVYNIRLDLEPYVAEISLKNELRLEFYQKISEYDKKTLYSIMPNKEYVPKFIIQNGKYHSGGYDLKLTQLKDLSTVIIKMVDLIMQNQSSLISFCDKSTNWNPDGTKKREFDSWKTDAKIIKISKEMPIQRMIQGISKQEQSSYNNSPFLHGSNGTYIENTNSFWCLTFKVKRLAYEVDKPEYLTLNIHNYITSKLMPKLGWEKITANRLAKINDMIKNKPLKVVTYDMDEPPIYREFIPEDSKSNWDSVLNELLSQLIQS